MFNQEYNTCDWWYRVQCKEEQTSRQNEIVEEELAIDVEDNSKSEDDEENTPTRRPILIQTIIFEDDISEDINPTIEFEFNDKT